jgi:hypothetical protein
VTTKFTTTFDHDNYRRHDWHEELIAVFEKINADDETPDNIKDDLIREMMFSFFYADCTCDECKDRKTPVAERKTNYPYRIEDDGGVGIIASYECRSCGHIYQMWYTKEFHTLQFG